MDHKCQSAKVSNYQFLPLPSACSSVGKSWLPRPEQLELPQAPQRVVLAVLLV
jgi:hypothetical protein